VRSGSAKMKSHLLISGALSCELVKLLIRLQLSGSFTGKDLRRQSLRTQKTQRRETDGRHCRLQMKAT